MLLICGEALFDLFVEGNGSGPVVTFNGRAGGSPYNVAIGLARLDSTAALLTGISTDFLGELLYSQLKSEKVETGYLVRSGRRTTLSVVGLDASGGPEYAFYGVGSADCSLGVDDLPVIDAAVTGLHFGSYSCVVEPIATAFETLARREAARFISFDPNIRLTVEPDVAIWRNRVAQFAALADLIKISEEDFEFLWPGEDFAHRAAIWLEGRASLVILTRGAKPAIAWTGKDIVEAAPAPRVEVIDTVGAGDSFQAALLHQLGRYGALKPAGPGQLDKSILRGMLDYATFAAGLTCSRRGADLPGAGDMKGFAVGGRA